MHHVSPLTQRLFVSNQHITFMIARYNTDITFIIITIIGIYNEAQTNLGYGHVCFMAHQVVEKALKGGVYALCGLDGRGLVDHNLTRHAYALQVLQDVPPETQNLAQHCIPLEDYYLDTRYPNRWPGYADVPSNHYTHEQALAAKDHAKAVLDIVETLMH